MRPDHHGRETATRGRTGAPDLAALVRQVPDFPRPGIDYQDLTPLLGSPAGFAAAVGGLAELVPEQVDTVVAVEARGFLFGGPLAVALGVGCVPVRKAGKLPRPAVEADYTLEYGTETVEMHADALRPGERVLLVDDVLATGGTLVAAAELVERLGAEVVRVLVVLELDALSGRKRLKQAGLRDVAALIHVGQG